MDEMSRFSFNEKTSSQVFLRASILKKIVVENLEIYQNSRET